MRLATSECKNVVKEHRPDAESVIHSIVEKSLNELIIEAENTINKFFKNSKTEGDYFLFAKEDYKQDFKTLENKYLQLYIDALTPNPTTRKQSERKF